MRRTHSSSLPRGVSNAVAPLGVAGPVTLTHEGDPAPSPVALANSETRNWTSAVPLVEVTLRGAAADVFPGAAVSKRLPGVTDTASGAAMTVSDTGTCSVGLLGEVSVIEPW